MTLRMPDDPALRALLVEALEAHRRLKAAEGEADQQRAIFRTAVARASAHGASLRVVGAALGISYGRVQQILLAEREMSQPAGPDA